MSDEIIKALEKRMFTQQNKLNLENRIIILEGNPEISIEEFLVNYNGEL